MAIAFGVVAVVFMAARTVLIPATFGKDGHYRAAAVDSIAVRPVKYAGRVECADCHK